MKTAEKRFSLNPTVQKATTISRLHPAQKNQPKIPIEKEVPILKTVKTVTNSQVLTENVTEKLTQTGLLLAKKMVN